MHQIASSLFCATPELGRKHRLFKQCRLPSRLFSFGSLNLWVCMCACDCAFLAFLHALFIKDLPGGPSVNKNKILQIFGNSFVCGQLSLYRVILTHLDMTPPLRFASCPPPLFPRDISVRWTKGRLPRTWFQFMSGESFPPSELLCFSREDFLSSNLVLSAHFLNWCRIICFACLVAMDNG